MPNRIDQWVEISWIVLAAPDRAAQIPESTRGVPLVARVKGFALTTGEIGDEVEIMSLAGRRLSGRLIAIEPPHTHSFGAPQPELMRIGRDLRQELAL